MKINCHICKKEIDINDGIQVKNPNRKRKHDKYLVICNECFEDGQFEFVGQLHTD